MGNLIDIVIYRLYINTMPIKAWRNKKEDTMETQNESSLFQFASSIVKAQAEDVRRNCELDNLTKLYERANNERHALLQCVVMLVNDLHTTGVGHWSEGWHDCKHEACMMVDRFLKSLADGSFHDR